MTPSHFGGNSTTSTTTQMTATPHITNYNKRWILAGSVIVFAVLRGLSMNPSFEGTALVASQEIPTDREIADPVLSESNSSNANNGSYGSSSDHGNIASLEVELISEDPLFCTNPNRTSSGQPECCSSWDVDVDDWWLHKPDWEVSRETEKVLCFAPIQNLDKASFLRQVHDRQYTHADCNKVETSVEMNSGFGASMRWLLLAFWHAHLAGNPFQIEWSRRRWLYSSGNQSSWAYCPSEDVAWYVPNFLFFILADALTCQLECFSISTYNTLSILSLLSQVTIYPFHTVLVMSQSRGNTTRADQTIQIRVKCNVSSGSKTI